MNYNEFATSIQSLDKNKLHIVRIPMDTPQQKMITLQKVLKQSGLQFIILPDTITLEELAEKDVEFLLRSAKPKGQENEG